jgi:hypothetical protein
LTIGAQVSYSLRTNLVNSAQPLYPEIKELCSANIFKKGPTYIPEPLVIEKNQRPFPIPN